MSAAWAVALVGIGLFALAFVAAAWVGWPRRPKPRERSVASRPQPTLPNPNVGIKTGKPPESTAEPWP